MKKYAPDWLDRMYNNRALVPGHEAHFARWSRDSAAVRATHACLVDLPYGSEPLERLDVFPAAQAGAPVVVFIHGGYWRAMDKADHSFVARAFMNLGACVVVPNYSLCPAVTIPDITLQMVKALAWVWRHAERYGGDPSRITVIGHSAGGQLAAMLLDCVWPAYEPDLPSDLVKGALSISGLFDLQPLMYTPFLQPALQLTADQVARASPARLPAPAQGALFAVVGGDESAEYLRQNRLIQQVWGRQVVPVCEEIPGRNHFSVLEDLTSPWARLHQLAIRLVFGSP